MSDVKVALGLDSAEMASELQAADRKFAQTTSGMVSQAERAGNSIGQKLFGGLKSGLAALGLGAAIKGLIDYGDQIDDLSQRFGVSSTALQEFGNAAEENGSSLEAVAGALQKLEVARSKALGGNDALVKSFANLNATAEELTNASPQELLKKIGSSSMNAADMVKILGKNSLELRPLLEGIASGAIEVGDVLSGETIAKLGDASDSIKHLTTTLRNVGGEAIGWFQTKWEQMWNAIVSTSFAGKEIVVGSFEVMDKAIHGDFKGARKLAGVVAQNAGNFIRQGNKDHDAIAKGLLHERSGPSKFIGAAGGDAGETDDNGNPTGGGSGAGKANELANAKKRLAEIEDQKNLKQMRFAERQAELQKRAAEALKRSRQDGSISTEQNGGSLKALPEIERVNAKLEYLKIVDEIAADEKEHAAEMKKADDERQHAAEKLADFNSKMAKAIKDALDNGGGGRGDAPTAPGAYRRHPDAYHGPGDPSTPDGKPFVSQLDKPRVSGGHVDALTPDSEWGKRFQPRDIMKDLRGGKDVVKPLQDTASGAAESSAVVAAVNAAKDVLETIATNTEGGLTLYNE